MITVYPALDLAQGRCVRLEQGDPGRQEVFSNAPAAVAAAFVAGGARALHVVDLDGAFAGGPRQLHLLREIVAAAGVPVQFGGGLRAAADVEEAFAAGAARVVVGTRALEQGFLRALLERWGPERVVVGLDARGEALAVQGWQQPGGAVLGEAARRVAGWGATQAVFTQVQRDGMLQGPDLAGLRQVVAAGLRTVASGGVTTALDIRAAAAIPGVSGVILGRALYTGRISLQDALAAAAG